MITLFKSKKTSFQRLFSIFDYNYHEIMMTTNWKHIKAIVNSEDIYPQLVNNGDEITFTFKRILVTKRARI